MNVPDKENMEYRQAQGLKVENSETCSKQDRTGDYHIRKGWPI